MLYMRPHTTKPAGVGVGRCVSELAGYIDRVLRDDGKCHAVKKKMRNSTDAQRFRLPFPSLVSAVWRALVHAVELADSAQCSTDAQRFLLRVPSLLVSAVWRALVPAS